MRTYRVQLLNGYTDGRESWLSIQYRKFWSRESAEEEMARLQKLNPTCNYRVRMVPKKK